MYFPSSTPPERHFPNDAVSADFIMNAITGSGSELDLGVHSSRRVDLGVDGHDQSASELACIPRILVLFIRERFHH